MFTCIGCTLILLFPQLHLSAPKDAPVQLPGAMMAQLEEQFRDFDSGAKEFRVVDWRILDTGDAVIVATATLDHDGKGAVGLLLAGKAPKGGMFAIDLFKVADRHQNQYAIDCCSPGRVTLRERTSVYCLPQAKHMYFYDAPQKKVLGKQAVDFLSIDFLAVQGHTLYAAGKRVGKPSDTSKPEVPVIVEVVPAEKGPGIASWKIISSVDGVPLSPLRRSPGEEGMVIFAGDRQEYVLNGDTWKARPVRGAMRNMAAYGNERFLVTGEDGYDPAVLPESLRAALKAPANAHGVAVFSEHGAKGAEFYAIPEI